MALYLDCTPFPTARGPTLPHDPSWDCRSGDGIPIFPVLFAICRTLGSAQVRQLGSVKVESSAVLGYLTYWVTTCWAGRAMVPFTGTGEWLSDRRGSASLPAISPLIGPSAGGKCTAWMSSKTSTSKTSWRSTKFRQPNLGGSSG